jgi:hypothetical protein
LFPVLDPADDKVDGEDRQQRRDETHSCPDTAEHEDPDDTEDDRAGSEEDLELVILAPRGMTPIWLSGLWPTPHGTDSCAKEARSRQDQEAEPT